VLTFRQLEGYARDGTVKIIRIFTRVLHPKWRVARNYNEKFAQIIILSLTFVHRADIFPQSENRLSAAKIEEPGYSLWFPRKTWKRTYAVTPSALPPHRGACAGFSDPLTSHRTKE
jgi:hypothetical protein